MLAASTRHRTAANFIVSESMQQKNGHVSFIAFARALLTDVERRRVSLDAAMAWIARMQHANTCLTVHKYERGCDQAA